MRILTLLLSLMACLACDDSAADAQDGGHDEQDGAPLDVGLVDASTTDATPPIDASVDPTLPSACNAVAPCGGDPVGEWVWERWCRDVEPDPLEACLAAEIRQDLTPMGTVTFAGDGRFVVEAEYSIERTTRLPPECVADECAGAAADLPADRQWRCEPDDASDECGCRSTEVLPGDDAGRWTVEGDVLTTRSDGVEDARPLWFCVTGDQLILRDLDADGPSDPVFMLRRR